LITEMQAGVVSVEVELPSHVICHRNICFDEKKRNLVKYG